MGWTRERWKTGQNYLLDCSDPFVLSGRCSHRNTMSRALPCTRLPLGPLSPFAPRKSVRSSPFAPAKRCAIVAFRSRERVALFRGAKGDNGSSGTSARGALSLGLYAPLIDNRRPRHWQTAIASATRRSAGSSPLAPAKECALFRGAKGWKTGQNYLLNGSDPFVSSSNGCSNVRRHFPVWRVHFAACSGRVENRVASSLAKWVLTF